MRISNKFYSGIMMVISILFSTLLLVFCASCSEDSNGPAPTITLSATEISNLAGVQVSTTVTVDAPEGGKTLAILVNGVADANLADVALDGTSSQEVVVEYTIPANAPVGELINITFKAIDKKDQESSTALFAVTVSAIPDKPLKQISGTITGTRNFVNDTIYVLNGFVRIGQDTKPTAGVVAPVIGITGILNIEAGTVIYGKLGTPGGTLIVQRGSKINAIGTANAPIIFTSDRPIGSRKSGDWGGVVLCGKAPNNIGVSTSTGVAGLEELEGAYGGFHGGGASPDAADNSGTLQYVRIEYAGYPINPNQELNGLTFGSVGSGTTIDHIQVTYANDDSYEWFGGTVNCTNLIAYKGIDDDFDTDNGFSGRVQFGLGIRDAAIADQSGSNGFECDNDAAGSSNTPYTNATFSNMTIIGGKATSGTTIDLQFQNGAQIRRNAKQDIINSFITAYPNGIYIDNALPGTVGVGTITNATNGELVFNKNILAGVEGWGANNFGSTATADEQTVFGLGGAGSQHPNAPRGRVIAGGVGAFTNGSFGGYTETTINSLSPIKWFQNSNATLLTTNTIMAKWNDASLGISATIFEPLSGTPTLLPAGGSILLSGADFSTNNYPTGANIGVGFSNVAYRGAFGATDWTTGWVNWNPQVTTYSK